MLQKGGGSEHLQYCPLGAEAVLLLLEQGELLVFIQYKLLSSGLILKVF